MDRSDVIRALVDEAVTIGDIQSAAIFVPGSGAGTLRLAGAAGISGPPLEGLVAAVQRPDHPVARALTDPGPTFDVRPMNPGGPALRSHLPLRRSGAGSPEASGVLAVAHDHPTSEEVREGLVALAARATGALA